MPTGLAAVAILAATVGAGLVVPGWLASNTGLIATPTPSQDPSGFQHCAEGNTAPCWAGTRSDERDRHRVMFTPAGNVTLEGQHTRMYFGPNTSWEPFWWNLSTEANPGAVTVEVTHPNGTTTWIPPNDDGWSNHSFAHPASGNWTVAYHPHTQLQSVEVHKISVVRDLVYEFGD